MWYRVRKEYSPRPAIGISWGISLKEEHLFYTQDAVERYHHPLPTNNFIMTTPDYWMIVQINENLYKVFATWSSGYLDPESWRMNSGIVRVEESEDYYDFYGQSGSCYHCKKDRYGSTGYGYSVLNHYRELVLADETLGRFEPLEVDLDWGYFFKKIL